MEIDSFETTDIFKGAFLLASGGELAEVRVRNNGRRIATFLIAGENLAEPLPFRDGAVWHGKCFC